MMQQTEHGANSAPPRLPPIAASAMPAPSSGPPRRNTIPARSDTEIKLGQTVPHSGPGSLYGVLGRVGEAYFQMLNEKGGINGRKVKFLTMDDAYSAAEMRRGDAAAGRAGGGAGAVRPRSAPRRRPPCTNISTPRACRSFCSTPAPRNGTIRRTSNGPWRACRSIRPKRAFSPSMSWREAEREDRHSLPERRFRPRFPRARSRRCWRMPAAPPR